MILASLVIATPGAFLLAGGGSTSEEMVKRFAELCGGYEAQVIVLSQTREDPAKGDGSVKMLKDHGFKDVILFADKEIPADKKSQVEATLRGAKGFWVPGGDQRLVVERLGADWGHEFFTKRIKEGVNWFGTSAGAMCVSDPMIRNDVTERGFGLVDMLIDTHFVKRNREQRLRKAFFANKHSLGLGLDEGEWVVIRNNQIEETHGKPRILMRE